MPASRPTRSTGAAPARPLEAELIGLIPETALAAYPEDVPIRSFDPEQHVIECRLRD